MKENLEYWLVLAVARTLGRMPRWLARLLAWWSCLRCLLLLFGRLRRVGARNLQMALPELSSEERSRILRGVYIHLGWQLVEFCRMTRYTAENARGWMRTEGLDHYLAAQARGKGVLVSPAIWAHGSSPAFTTR
jgi:KDO2-lipid IV(A) lauroyltransferase